jgi:hypothetical protein
MKRSLIVIDDFYASPDTVRATALKTGYASAGRFNYPG